MNWMYVNPFWHTDRFMASQLDAEVCRQRLKAAPMGRLGFARIWPHRGDFTFAETGPRTGSVFEMHVQVDVSRSARGGSALTLRFSAGPVSAVVFCIVAAVSIVAFIWTVSGLLSGSGWTPIDGAGLLAILVPVLFVFGLRAEAPSAEQNLWDFVAEQVEGTPAQDNQ